MTWITDNPLPLFILGLLIQVVLGVILWQTGRGWIMYLMIVLALCSVGLLVLERYLVSPAEEIADTLDEISQALETNKVDNVLRYLAPDAPGLHADARQKLSQVVISKVSVSKQLQIQFDQSTQPTATAAFNAWITAKEAKGGLMQENMEKPFPFRVTFRKEAGKWLVTGYKMTREP